MAGNATETSTSRGFFEHYDWRCWASWRALLATSLVIGAMCSAAVLAADSVVRDLLGMELGRAYFGGADILAVVLALGFNVPGLVIWIRYLRNSENGPVERPPARLSRTGFRDQLLEPALFMSWYGASLAVFVVIHGGTGLIVAEGQTGRLGIIVPVSVLAASLSSLHLALGRLGATRCHLIR